MNRTQATIRDVAARARVSTATVSRVVNEDTRVAAATRDRVLAAVEALGYKMNQVARSLKKGATRTVGLVAPELASDFFMLLAESLDRELSIHGYSILVCSSWETVEEEKKRIKLLSERLVDGIVMIPATDQGRHLRSLQASGTPLVFIDRIAKGVAADAVLVDNEGGAREATLALVADGHRRIGFLGGSLEVSVARERYEGFTRAMRESGLEVEDAFTRFGSLHVESGFRIMAEMLARPDPPGAYFIVNADTHVGATNYLMTEGRERRDGIVFASFDEMPYSPLLQLCRWSVSQPIAEMGRQAARILLARMRGEGGSPELLRLGTTLLRH